MNRYKGKAARWQPKDKEEQRMNKTEFIKVRCTLEEKQRIKSKAESAGRKFSDYCREILLNGEVVAVPKMTENEREAIAKSGKTKCAALIKRNAIFSSKTRCNKIKTRTA